MQRSREPRFASYGVCHALLRFSSRLIYVNARMNSFQRDLSQEHSRIFDASDTGRVRRATRLPDGHVGSQSRRDQRRHISEVMRRCKSCSYRDACAVDLKRDPNNPVWETYCPNTGAFFALAEARHNHETIKSLYKISE